MYPVQKKHKKQLLSSAVLLSICALSTNGFASGSLPSCAQASINEICQTNGAGQSVRQDKIISLYESLKDGLDIINGTDTTTAPSIFETDPAAGLKGRVTPAGTFAGISGAEEYFWGLGTNTFTQTVSVNIKSMTAGNGKVGIETDVNMCQRQFYDAQTNKCKKPDGTVLEAPYGEVIDEASGQRVAFTFTQTGFFSFNKNNKVISYDLSILNLGAVSKPLEVSRLCAILTLPQTVTQIPGSGNCVNFWNRDSQYPKASDGLTANGVVLDYSYAPNSAYGPDDSAFNAYENCKAYLTQQIPEGTWFRANSNTQVCRSLHMILTPYRQVHCGHSGPKGLDVMPVLNPDGTQATVTENGKQYPAFSEGKPKCADFSYGSYYESDY